MKQTSGGESSEGANTVATDASGNLYLAGLFKSDPIAFGSSVIRNSNGFDFFVAKLGSAPTGNKDLSNLGEFDIYPNPGNGHFILKSERKIKTIEVYTISGTKIYTHNSTNDSGSVTIDISSFPSGIYMVSIFDGKKRYTEKLIMHKG